MLKHQYLPESRNIVWEVWFRKSVAKCKLHVLWVTLRIEKGYVPNNILIQISNPLDPTDLRSNMCYFPRISPNSLKNSPEFRANIQIQRPTAHTCKSKQYSFFRL